jgi:uncharacterized membrane protein YqhA
MLIASVGTTIGALVMFWEGTSRMLEAARVAWHATEPKAALAHIMGGTDAFLFGIVLVIFAYTIAFGFVFQLTQKQRSELPQWMRASDMTEMKTTLVGVVLVYLVVDFATDWAEDNFIASWVVLVKPISIVLIAIAARLLITPDEATEPAAKS